MPCWFVFFQTHLLALVGGAGEGRLCILSAAERKGNGLALQQESFCSFLLQEWRNSGSCGAKSRQSRGEESLTDGDEKCT
uniref:Secreted protein n=1 Tax=Oryza nivara TaxID=4536 RepID=A0A0E0FL50_ORYNI